jgi:translocation and assembly module TamB
MRRVLVIVLYALGGAALAMVLAVALLLGTNRGARRVLSWMPGGTLTAREVRGALKSPLELDDVEYRTSGLSITIGHLVVHWQLSGLARRSLEIGTLRAERVRIRAIGPAQPSAGPVRLPDIRLPLDVHVRELRVRDFRWVPRDGGDGFALDEVRGALAWRDSALRIDSLAARSRVFDLAVRGHVVPRGDYPLDLAVVGALTPAGRGPVRGAARVTGSLARTQVAVRLDAPCTATVQAELRDVVNDPAFDGTLVFSGFDPRTLAPGAPDLRLDGRLAARGTIGGCTGEGRVSMTAGPFGPADAEFALARAGDSLKIAQLALTTPGRPLRVNADGVITGLGATPRVDATLAWERLVWPLAGRDTVFFSRHGTARVAGVVDRYTLELDTDFALPGLDLGHWRLAGAGDARHVGIERFAAQLPEGPVRGAGRFEWTPRPAWSATVSGDALDPGHLWPALPGRLALSARTSGSVVDGDVTYDVRVDRLEGVVRTLAFTGRGTLTGRDAAWSVRDVGAEWAGARLALEGSGGPRWALDATVEAPALAPFAHGAAGALNARLGIAGPSTSPRYRIDARGDSLVFGGLSARSLHIAGELGTAAHDPVDLAVDAQDAAIGALAYDTLTVRADGTPARHTVHASAHGTGPALVVEAAGGLVGDQWRGRLEELDLQSREAGTWQLEAPVAAELSAGAARIDSFCFRSGTAGLCGAADWRAGGRLHARARISAVPLALLEPWLPAGARVNGTIAGSLEAHAERDEGPLMADARFASTPVEILLPRSQLRADTLRFGAASLTAASDATGSRAAFAIGWDSGNALEVSVSAVGFDPLRPDTTRPLMGHLRVRAPDLARLAAFVPGLDRTAGRLEGDVEFSGTVGRPEGEGEIRLREGRAGFPALGVSLEDARFTLHAAPGGGSTLEGSIRSGKGTLAIRGTADFARPGHPVAELRFSGKDFQAANTREADVHVSPDIQMKLDGTRLDLSGQLDVPFARLVTSDRVGQLPVPRSPDVVLVGTGRDTARTALELHSRVRIVIGDDVEIRVPRFQGRPEGSILAIDEPGQATLASGELEVKEGIYRAYGQDLKIDRGKLVFGGGPIENPGLDLRATRTADDGTIAGVNISGTAEKPIVTLFTNPAMSENDALSYIMFGKPASEASGSAGTQAASQLGVEGTDMLARGVAGKFGIQGASVESKEGSMQDASLFLGTYVSPKLYVSYGIGLFESATTLRVRYKMNKRWSVQTESGSSRSGLLQYSGER